jgi:hypothetical protein
MYLKINAMMKDFIFSGGETVYVDAYFWNCHEILEHESSVSIVNLWAISVFSNDWNFSGELKKLTKILRIIESMVASDIYRSNCDRSDNVNIIIIF